MPSSLLYYSSFVRSIKTLAPQQKTTAGSILETMQIYLDSAGNLTEAQRLTPGFFLKKLRTPYYEAGVERQLRIVFEKHDGDFYAILVGNHDQIRRFLAVR
jgi:hypothetical protein